MVIFSWTALRGSAGRNVESPEQWEIPLVFRPAEAVVNG